MTSRAVDACRQPGEGSDLAIRWWRTDLGRGEAAAVAAAIRSRRINQGPECRRLEEELAKYLDVSHTVLTTSGSTALLLALKAWGIGPGDQVIVPALTFIAPAHAVLWLGAAVRLADVLPHRPLIDPDEVARLVNDRTKAIVAVHLNGRAADIGALRSVVRGRPIAVIEDCAQALGSRSQGRALGTQADAGTFSLSISKLITTGEGGFVATSDPGRYRQLARLRNHGILDLKENVFAEIGFNFRFTDLQAAIGLAQMQKIEQRIAALRAVYRRYREGLDGLHFLRLLDADRPGEQVPLWVEAVCARRPWVLAELRRRGIEAKPFHPCLCDSPHLRAAGSFPNARRFAAEGIILPSGPDQRAADIDRVCDALREIGGLIDREPATAV